MISVDSKYERQVGELSVLHEIAWLRLSAPVDELADEAMEKAVRLFGLSRFALLLREEQSGDRLASACGLRDRGDLMQKLSQVDPRRFSHPLGDDGELGLLFMERSGPIQENELRLYRVFARRLEDGLQRAKMVRERELGEDALRKGEEEFRTLFEQMKDAVYVVSPEGIIQRVNQAGLDLLGYRREEMMGMEVSNLYADQEERRQALQELEREGVILGHDLRMRKKSGEVMDCTVTSGILRDPDGTVTGYLKVVRDVTRLREIEAERRKLEQRAQIASRLTTVGEMAAGIAHEINNPLTSVIGFAQLLAQKDMPDELKEYAQMVSDGGERVASIVKRLLAFARQQKPQSSYVDVNEIVDTSLQLRAYELKTNNIEVVRRLDRDLPWTMADPGQLQQVFLNLIMNAETAMRAAHGGGRLTVSSRRKDDTICVSFRDNGPGISKADLEKIFDPFFTTKDVGEGTGLGLSICHGIVSEHKGRIYARSKPGRGSTFYMELPIEVEQRQLELSEEERQALENQVHGKILVVDDEPPILQFLEQVLREEGHEVCTTTSAEGALERIQNERYSLILVDIKLPGMSGSELYNRVRQMARSLAHRVVFITGDLMSNDTRSFVSRARVPCIAKPFNAEGIKREVRRLLS